MLRVVVEGALKIDFYDLLPAVLTKKYFFQPHDPLDYLL